MIIFFRMLIEKVCKSNAFAVFFALLIVFNLIGSTTILFLAHAPQFAVANILACFLLLCFWFGGPRYS